ncbi:hypothetical protein BDW72DRAFT_109244 [Aspergillus terricola var. indicus]
MEVFLVCCHPQTMFWPCPYIRLHESLFLNYSLHGYTNSVNNACRRPLLLPTYLIHPVPNLSDLLLFLSDFLAAFCRTALHHIRYMPRPLSLFLLLTLCLSSAIAPFILIFPFLLFPWLCITFGMRLSHQ